MVASDVIEKQLDRCIRETNFRRWGEPYRGKVRDVYSVDDERLALVATDRISAFDHILRQPIPFKGQVLNQLAAHFFAATGDRVPNHVLSVPDPNVTIAQRCTVFPIEFVVREYMAGHAWREYAAGRRTLCGVSLPDGLRRNSKLPEPIITPTTKATEGHDEDISRREIVSRRLIDEQTLAELESMALTLFDIGTRMAAERGLILVDTKYEFGRTRDGGLVVVDEVHTPDSSRYFYSDTYEELLERDRPQRQLSKEFVREWLMANGFRGRAGENMPDLPADFRIEVSQRYIELFETVTGAAFQPAADKEPLARIERSLRHL